ncbi:hypothetical protein M0805_008410 [Coniferiporia weirii]|nr:hypothetical protein M0805_008410 [Coniferiporia weirii]
MAERPTGNRDVGEWDTRTDVLALGFDCTEPAPRVHPSYNRGVPIRRLTFAGLTISSLFGAGCVIIGAIMRRHSLPISSGIYDEANLQLNLIPSYKRELYLLLLNVTFVKLCLWSTGSAHNAALKWKLASEDDKHTGKTRLEFNASLRFFQSSNDPLSPNGLAANVIMALCLTVSYASSSMVLLNVKQGGDHNTVVSSVALTTLGATILLQAVIAIWTIRTTHIPTWSQSPFDTAAALVGARRLQREPGRCMYSLYDKYQVGPIRPPEQQEPFWDCHPLFRSLVLCIWVLFGSGFYWFFIVLAMILSDTQGAQRGTSWALIPNENTPSMNIHWSGEAPTAGVLWGFGILVGYQGGVLTSALVCTQAIASLIRDERLWRAAATDKGTDPAPSPLKNLFISRHILVIHIADPVLHWMFGLAISVDAKSGFQICPVQILYVTLTGTVYAIFITIACCLKHNRTQPLTYGHLQTLVNLVDKWDSKMFWGDKSDNSNKGMCHAGTSNKPLPQVDRGQMYGCARYDC